MLSEVEKNLSYAQQAYLKLKKAIISNSLKPGEILNERQLAAALNVSRTPLRDALQMLQQDGWLTSSGKNKIVTPITWKDIEEIYELRLVNEAFALDLAARTFAEINSQQMQKLLDQMASYIGENSYMIDYLEKDKSFHLYIAEIGGNRKLFNLMKSITEQFIRIGFITFKKGDLRLKESYQEHVQIFEACAEGDFEKAKKASKTHIQAWFNTLKENWEEL